MRVFHYKLPLTQPIRLGADSIENREGLLLESNGQWSEVAPLPHFSKETLEDVVDALQGRSLAPASLQFAMDALSRPLNEQSQPINALLQGAARDIRAKCDVLAESACQAVKLKVGRDDVKAEIDLVRRVRESLRHDQSLRLDANRAWDWPTAIEFAAKLDDIDIEFIEEPLRDCRRLEAFANETNLRYALDETLSESETLYEFEHAAAFVVKPTILGGRKRLQAIADLGKPMVFSACYESGVGLARIIQLANEWSPSMPAGLDTYAYLGNDVLSQRLEVKDWRMRVPPVIDVNYELLEEIVLS